LRDNALRNSVNTFWSSSVGDRWAAKNHLN
jgi:hypothetical protein